METLQGKDEKEKMIGYRLAQAYVPGGWFMGERITCLGLLSFLVGIVLSSAGLFIALLASYGIWLFAGGVFTSCLGLGIASWASTPDYTDEEIAH